MDTLIKFLMLLNFLPIAGAIIYKTILTTYNQASDLWKAWKGTGAASPLLWFSRGGVPDTANHLNNV